MKQTKNFNIGFLIGTATMSLLNCIIVYVLTANHLTMMHASIISLGIFIITSLLALAGTLEIDTN